jgi:branched-chain amino acid transport system permease protein
VAQQLVNGVFLGSVYALFALGYTLIFGVLDILNLAHQAVFMVGAFVALTLVLAFGVHVLVALGAAMLVCGLLGIVLDRVAFAPLRRRADTHFSALISSIAAGLILEATALYIYGARVSRFPIGSFPEEPIPLGFASVSAIQVTILVVSVGLMVGLQYVVRRTRLGLAMRAVAENPRAAQLLGVNVDAVIAQSFFISSALGGAAGVLFGLAFNAISPDVGRSIELKGLAVIIVGGMGSIPGAVVGGFALGLIEVLSVALSGQSSLRDAIAFACLFLFLVVRPTGIFGGRGGRAD